MKHNAIRTALQGLFLIASSFFTITPANADEIYGRASYYRTDHHGTTASGEIYDGRLFTAAHPELPFGSMVRVTHLKTNDSVVVRVNDRNPFNSGHAIDVSYAAAERLGILNLRIAEVSVAPLAATPQLQSQAKHVPLPESARKTAARTSANTILKKLVPVTSKSAKPGSAVWQEQQKEAATTTQELAPAEDGSSANRPLLRVQFGAFSDASKARTVREELRQMNIDTMIVHSDEPGSYPLRLMTSGVFFEQSDAVRWLKYIQYQTGRYSDAFITR
tara:strand:- start:11028 stop:11855 length:828 start_codon:yes stop_codon:yes gene_type:complete